MARTSQKYKNVFSHGDIWANNVMFQYARDNKAPTNCCFVDFQFLRYAPPMLDLITILTIHTSRKFRKRYMMILLKDYLTFLRDTLKQHHLSHLTILLPDCTQALAVQGWLYRFFLNAKE